MSLVDDTRILLSSAGKGGVGKSTVSIGVSLALARRGLAVGALDLDVRAPNLTYLLKLEDRCAVTPQHHPIPATFTAGPGGFPGASRSIAVFSPAMMFRQGASILMPGDTLRSLATDYLTVVEWPRLDWLVVDMDPAPADSLKAVRDIAKHVLGLVVTSPDKTSVEDARRMLDAYTDLGIATVGMIGNMVGLRCQKCGEVIINGASSTEMYDAAREFHTRYLAHLPWDTQLHEDPVGASQDRFGADFDRIAAAAIATEA